MAAETTIPPTPDTMYSHCDRTRFPFLCWKAIIGGKVPAIGIHILLTASGVGAGLATFTPMTDVNPCG